MMPLYDILNEFQKGHSHMAVVVRHCDKTKQQSSYNNASGIKAHAIIKLKLYIFNLAFYLD